MALQTRKMKSRTVLIVLLAASAMAGPASSTETAKGTAGAAGTPKPLDGPAIIRHFEGKTVSGAYANGRPVRESYAVGGRIEYWDPGTSSTGTWSVVNNLLCTFYDNAEMRGGCFRIEQVNSNCFDYLVEASSTAEALSPPGTPTYTARAHIEGTADTCPDELAV